ncbi:MAG: ATP phosphoribosyltransferase regulatory subunit [Leptospirales bacterium]|nr:ATP phosphoribosyltransferase regulatory subunit [Leptospirales bacterium]
MAATEEERFRNWIPHGFDYLDPSETALRLQLSSAMRAVFAAAGYLEVVPPAFDFAATFELTERHGISAPAFRTRGGEGQMLAPRADLTVQVIKAVASGRLAAASWPAQFCYLQSVYHDEHWGLGRRRELFQAGVEWIGENQAAPLRSILQLARRCLAEVGDDLRIIYGDARFPGLLLEESPPASRAALAFAFYAKDTAELRRICSRHSIEAGLAALLCETPLCFGGPEALQHLDRLTVGRPNLTAVLDEARDLENVVFDFSLVRTLSYYTGPVFEGYVTGSKERILSGGVYDSLYREFAGIDRNACGFAIELGALAQSMAYKGVIR